MVFPLLTVNSVGGAPRSAVHGPIGATLANSWRRRYFSRSETLRREEDRITARVLERLAGALPPAA
jgi:hypothetical protein